MEVQKVKMYAMYCSALGSAHSRCTLYSSNSTFKISKKHIPMFI